MSDNEIPSDVEIVDEDFEDPIRKSELVDVSQEGEQKKVPKLKDTLAGIASFLFFLFIIIGAIIVLIFLFTGVDWIAKNVYPKTNWLAALSLVLIVPISLLLSIFRKTRSIGAIGLLISSYIWGLNLWIWSFIIAYSLAGIFWLIVGFILGGLGVVPIAIIACLIHSEWSVALQIGLGAIIVLAVRGFSIFLAEKSE